jgi:branched-chain amino acid transport system ATP-binding protein
MAALLEVDNLHAHYDKSHILHGVSLKIAPGEIVSLLGRNGSGRSTTLKAIMGLVRPTAGRVVLEGKDLAGLRAYRIARAGIAYVPEEREIFANVTVASPRARAWRRGACSRCTPSSLSSRIAITRQPACCPAASSRC